MPHETVERRALHSPNSPQLCEEPDPETAAEFHRVLEGMKAVLAAQNLRNIKPSLRRFAPDSLACVLRDPPGAYALDRFRIALTSTLVADGHREPAAEVAARIQGAPRELLLNASNPLVQSLCSLRNFRSEVTQGLLLGLYHLAVLDSQRRLSPGDTCQIDGYLQARLEDILQLQTEVAELRRQVSAWQRCVVGSADAQAEDWAVVLRDVVGVTSKDFRDRVARASETELGELLLNLYLRLRQAEFA